MLGTQQQYLRKKYDFPILPFDHPVVVEANYTPQDVQSLQVFSGPVFDEENFYYCTYWGNLFANNFKNGLLVCRRKKDGSLVYIANTQSYNLDVGATMMGVSRMVSRSLPVIKGDRLYLTSGWLTNIGPQLFCIDKRTGIKIYSIAYDLPKDVAAVYGTSFLTTRDNYSTFKGSNAAICTHDPIVKKGKIYVGTSSLQNVFNPGLIQASSNYNGYPFWTDRGCLAVIKEFYSSAVVEARTFTCASEFRVGDILSTVIPEKNPFIPGTTEVLIATTTTGVITTPGSILGNFFFTQKVDTALAPVTAANVAPFWSTVGSTITVTSFAAQVANLDLTQALALVNAVPGLYSFSVSTPNPGTITGTLASGQFAVWYVKELTAGETVANIYDANGLGYYGNSIWGSNPDLQCGRIAYGTGQSHSSPISERLQFSDPDTNYRLLKQTLVDLSNLYALNPVPSNPVLALLNQEKIAFNRKIRELSLAAIRSPRGQRSYSDAILASDICTGEILFGVRSVQNDVYTFLTLLARVSNPIDSLPIPRQDIDGDLSSGVHESDGQLSASTKNGGLLTINLAHWDKCKWTHGSPCSVGINVEPIVYTGPNSLLGGTNYDSTSRKTNSNLHLLALSSNTSANDGSRGTDGISTEKFVTEQGKYIPPTFSFAFSYNQDRSRVEWNTQLLGTGSGNSTVVDDLFLTADNSGHLYVINAKNGHILQTIDSGTDIHPMKGGIASPSVDICTRRVFWISSYDTPGQVIPTSGAYGWVLRLKKNRK